VARYRNISMFLGGTGFNVFSAVMSGPTKITHVSTVIHGHQKYRLISGGYLWPPKILCNFRRLVQNRRNYS
jgi:hypothetical protein